MDGPELESENVYGSTVSVVTNYFGVHFIVININLLFFCVKM